MAKARHARPSKMRTTARAAAAAAPAGVISLAIAAPAYAGVPSGQIQQANQIVSVPLPAIIRVVRAQDPLYTVAPGNSLSQIAQEHCGTPSDWTGIYEANKHQIQNPDEIYPGQHLALECRQVQGITDPGSQPPVQQQAVVTDHASYSGHSSGESSYRGSHRSYSSPGGYGNVNPAGYSGIESCIISRESGGQAQVMNASGHYGLFQFDYGTWVSGGGSGADFGHASVAEQQRVFSSVYAARGSEPWSPSDGC